MGTPAVQLQTTAREHFYLPPTNPMQEEDIHTVKINPPPTKRWVTFQDWDEEALEYKASGRRHSAADATTSNLSSSVSSDSSLGSAGEGRRSVLQLTGVRSGSLEDESKELTFNASFGGFKQNGDAAALRTMFQPPSRRSPILRRLSPSSTLSSEESIPSLKCAEVRTKYSTWDEVRVCEVEERSRYSAFDEVRKDGVYLGWSNTVLGNSLGWTEDIKNEASVLRPRTLLTPPDRCSENPGDEVTVETLSTPEISGIRTISWPRSPTRSFVRNFP